MTNAVKAKRDRRRLLVRLVALVFHAAIIAAVSYLLLGNWSPYLIGAIFASHLLIDGVKISLGKDTAIGFVVDQLVHLLVLVVLACLFPDVSAEGWWMKQLEPWQQKWFYTVLCFTSGIILLVPTGGILISKLTDGMRKEVEGDTADDSEKDHQIMLPDEKRPDFQEKFVSGLKNGSRNIGWLERFLAMILFMIGQPAGIGFLIAAKSILRFGDIKEARHRKAAEYVIIGTFLSFGWAILISLLMKTGVDHWQPQKTPETKPITVILQETPE